MSFKKYVNAGVPREPFTLTYSTAAALDTTFMTLAASVNGPSDEIIIFENAGVPSYISWVSSNDTAGAATITSNCFICAPGGGQYPLHVPSGAAMYIRAVSDTAVSGTIHVTRFSEAFQ